MDEWREVEILRTEDSDDLERAARALKTKSIAFRVEMEKRGLHFPTTEHSILVDRSDEERALLATQHISRAVDVARIEPSPATPVHLARKVHDISILVILGFVFVFAIYMFLTSEVF